ncbi:hypothetical protein PVK06_017272 [Gossypium arboreum]|uniref:Uncharacterized protein n=1 Tax=Gossypium arboreum TaxID=29729 RepID=A0ABR0Q296_GOSAR|nr:hypothetical protein PVK06_017272 [Gossypium arboreum]
MTLFHHRVTSNTFKFVVDKIQGKLDSWDAKMLSIASRVTLVRSFLILILNFFMQTIKIPLSTSVEIEKITQEFIWGKDRGRHKLSLVKWSDCCQPLTNGGICLRYLKELNDSFLLKFGFNLLTNKQALLVKLLRAKYKVKDVCPMDISKGLCSFV